MNVHGVAIVFPASWYIVYTILIFMFGGAMIITVAGIITQPRRPKMTQAQKDELHDDLTTY